MTPQAGLDPKLAALACAYAERQEPLPLGRWGSTTAADLARTRFLIIHGKSIDSSRQGMLTYSNLETGRQSRPAEEER